MTDLHTHILCGVDDGAKTPQQSLQMLQMERDQGVRHVVLTPHFYRDRMRPEEFFALRQKGMDELLTHLDSLEESERQSLPRLHLAAEVAWRPNMDAWDDLEKFCIPGTRNLLLELPFTRWDRGLTQQLQNLMSRTGISPVLAHVERYLAGQDVNQLAEIISLGLPVQITAAELLRFSGRREALKALKTWAHIVATDCHDLKDRRPRLGEAMTVVQKRLGPAAAEKIRHMSDSLIHYI